MVSKKYILATGVALMPSIASAGSPVYSAIFQSPLPMPPVATPYTSATVDGQNIDFYEMTIQPFQKQVFDGLGPADFIGYNGLAPGPTFRVERGTQTVIRFHNNQTRDSVTHLHGSWTHSPWDGWAADMIMPGQYKDYYYPNDQNSRSLWYHDHADSITSGNCYQGLTAAYIIYDPAEGSLNLPTGKYDVPLMITDKMYDSNGALVSVDNVPTDFYGDVMEVNYQPWPYFEVEPRKYRLRLYNMALSRPFDLHIEQPNGDWLDLQVIASDAGLFAAPVSTNNVVISSAERYEIVVDFAQFAGQNLTMKNTYNSDGIPDTGNMDLIMSFVVGQVVTDAGSNQVPAVLNPHINWPEPKTEVDHVFRFSFGGDAHWTINGVDFDDVENRILARPPQGSVELWELVYASGPGTHPVHVHLVDFQVISRTGAGRGVLPYEAAGLKDVVLLAPGETVRVLAYYGPWNGLYIFHCHNLPHEDHMMMATFNVTALEGLGYDNVEDLSDPVDPRFVAQDYSPDIDTESSIQSKLSYLGGLGAYNQRAQIQSAIAAYYSTQPAAASESSTESASNQAFAAPTQYPGAGYGSGHNGFETYGAAPTQTEAANSGAVPFGPANHGSAPTQSESDESSQNWGNAGNFGQSHPDGGAGGQGHP